MKYVYVLTWHDSITTSNNGVGVAVYAFNQMPMKVIDGTHW